MRASFVLAAVLFGSTGCYNYISATNPADLTHGAEVSIDLTSTGAANVRPSIGDFVTTVEGRVSEAGPEGITLELMSVKRRGDVSPSTWHGESLQLGISDIGEIQRRELSRGKTAVAITALAAASVGLVIAIAKATGLLEVSGGAGKPIPPP